MKTYSNDKTLKILLALMIVGLFLNFFKPMVKDAFAADIDCLIMRDELMGEIQELNRGVKLTMKSLASLIALNTDMVMDIALNGPNLSKDELLEMYRKHKMHWLKMID